MLIGLFGNFQSAGVLIAGGAILTLWLILALQRKSAAPGANVLAPTPLGNLYDAATRNRVLVLLRAEVARAFHAGEIRLETYEDMKRCIDLKLNPETANRQAADSIPAAAAPPRPVPQAALQRIAERVHPPQREISPGERKEDAGGPLAESAPHAVSDQPAAPEPARMIEGVIESSPGSETVELPGVSRALEEAPVVRIPPQPRPFQAEPLPSGPKGLSVQPRSWTERLFTAENVRILQSLGIGIIFLSAVAFVHAQMWNGATGFTQLLLLAGGTLCCSGLGILLLRFTHLRLTALCFLILGQLSILIDLYAVRVFDGVGGGIFFNTASESQWWTLGFAFFSVSAYVQSRLTRELLFEAFAYFGALAAWGAGMIWMETRLFLLPASFVPVLLFSALLARKLAAGELPRWTLPWWLQSGVVLTAPFFCVALPAAALFSGQANLARDFHWHALAILLFAGALLKDAWTKSPAQAAHVPAVLLLSIAPLAAYAHSGVNGNGDLWSLALTLPGMVLAAAGMVLLKGIPARASAAGHLVLWGTLAAGLGSVFALNFALAAASTPLLLASAGAVFGLALLRTIVLREPGATWLATAAAAFALNEVFAMQKFPAEDLPLGALLLAGALHALWRLLQAQSKDHAAPARAGQTAADVLASLAAGGLVLITPFISLLTPVPLSGSLQAAWVVLALYVLGTSLQRPSPLRRTLGVLLLAPAAMPPQLGAASYYARAPWLIGLAVCALGLVWALQRREKEPPMHRAGLRGSAGLIGYAALMALLQGVLTSELGGGISLFALGAVLALQTMLVRSELDARWRACLGESLAMLLLATGLGFLASHLGVSGREWFPALALIAALVLFAGLALESLAGGLLGEKAHLSPGAFLESRAITVALLAALATSGAMSGRVLEMPQLDAAWRTLLSVSLLTLYFTLARSSRAEALNRSIRVLAAALAYIVLIPGTYLLFLKAQSSGSSWGALWFLALAPVLMIAGYVQRREREARLSEFAFLGAGLVAAGALILAFTGNRANLAAVPCATLACTGGLALLARRIRGEKLWTSGALLALTGAAFYGLRAACGDPAWMAFAPNPWEMPFLSVLGLAALGAGWLWGLEPLASRPKVSCVALHGFVLALAAAFWALVLLFQFGSGSTLSVRLDMLILCVALLAPVFLLAQRALEFEGGRYAAVVSAGLAYVLQMWTAQPQAWEWYTLPLALFLFAWVWELAREGAASGVGAGELNGLLGLACAFALLPSFIQGLPWNEHDQWHVLALAIIGFALVFGALATRRKVPLLAASGAILCCLLIHAVHLALNRQMMLPVGGLIAGFSVLAVASLFESRVNANVRSAVDRARAEARMFWTSWN